MPTWKTLAALILAPFLQDDGASLKTAWGRIELKPAALHLYVETWPVEGKVTLPRLNNPIGTVYLLNDPDKTPLGFQPNVADWSVSKPKIPTTGPQVVVVEVQGKPRIAGEPVIGEAAADGSITLPAHQAAPHGRLLRYEPQPHKNTVGYWADAADWVEWKFRISTPGRYTVQLLQGCGKGQGGSTVKVLVAGRTLDYTVEDTGHFQNFVERPAGTVAVEKAGDYTLELRVLKKAKGAVMDVRQVKLVPAP